MGNKLLTVLLDVALRYLPYALGRVFSPGPRKHRMDPSGVVCLQCGMDLRDPEDKRWLAACVG